MKGVVGEEVESLELTKLWYPLDITSIKSGEKGQFVIVCRFWDLMFAEMELETCASDKVISI